MASWGNCDFRQLQGLRDQLGRLQGAELDRFCTSVSKELAARLLALVIPKTPVGKYDRPVRFTTADGREVSFTPHSGKKGGTLRRGWTARTEAEAKGGTGSGSSKAKAYANALPVTKQGGIYTVEVINPVHYASYVEFGHRKRGGNGWVQGQYFLTISERELQQMAPRVIEQKLRRYLREAMGGNG